jgi:NAD(P)H-flavin reductase
MGTRMKSHLIKPETIDKNNKKLSTNPYRAESAKIIAINMENDHVKTFTVGKVKGTSDSVFNFKPGQFAIWSLPGIGEAPFSYSCHGEKNKVQFTIQKVGKITNAIFKLNEGDIVGIRGPYGNGFPLEKMKGRDMLFVMGGLGSAPLRGVLHHVLAHKEEFGSICVFHGARNPSEMLFKQEFENFIDDPNVTCLLTVDSKNGSEDWAYEEGVVTTLFDRYQEQYRQKKVHPNNTTVLICGPPIMYKFVIKKLLEIGISQDEIYMTLERRMKCGVGKCGHCVIDYVYTCVDGPVFTYWDAKYFKDVI